MTNLFQDGVGDARQTDGDKTELFRPRYRSLTAVELALHDAIKVKASELADLIWSVGGVAQAPPTPWSLASLGSNVGANKTLAIRHLEDAVYRAVKALTT